MGSFAPALIQAKLWLDAPCPGWPPVDQDDVDAALSQAPSDGGAHDARADDRHHLGFGGYDH